MIRTERLHIVPLNYYELLSYVYSMSGMISNKEEQGNVVEYSLKQMKKACKFTFLVHIMDSIFNKIKIYNG